MIPSILAGRFSQEQAILLLVLVAVVPACLVMLYKQIELHFGRLPFKTRKRVCRIGQRIFVTIFVCGVIGSLLGLAWAPYLVETSDANMSISSYCLGMWAVLSAPMMVVGVLGWGCLVCLDFMPVRRKDS